jgi:hypothetical protein
MLVKKRKRKKKENTPKHLAKVWARGGPQAWR